MSIRGIVQDAHVADIGGFTIAESVKTAAPATPAVLRLCSAPTTTSPRRSDGVCV